MMKNCRLLGFSLEVQVYAICLVAQLWNLYDVSGDQVPLNVIGKPAWTSGLWEAYPPSSAIDGNVNTFFHTALSDPRPLPLWQVDLQDVFCLGSITVTLRADCCDGDRFVTAVARAGLNFNITENQACGSPATRAQSAPGSVNTFPCDPPRMARYVSFDIDASNPLTTDRALMLAEVTVKELTSGDCSVPTSPIPVPVCSKTTPVHFKMMYEGAMIGNSTPLATSVTTSVNQCTVNCLKHSRCVSFDDAPETKQCRLHDLNAQDAVKIPSEDTIIYTDSSYNP